MIKIQLHNTLTRQKEAFVPIDEKNVRMYVCGPTVYDKAHIGNAKTAVVFDILYRLLRLVYGKEHVKYSANITDVDDKILDKHKETGQPIREITEQTLQWYLDNMKALNVLDPDYRPRATDFIPEMIDLVKKLLENGYAYESQGHVLFDTQKMPNYGYLSGRSLKELIAGARVEVADYKKHPADFILWKPSTSDQPGWDSPWGFGRPGWHLECSAMSSKNLGNSFDIHGGGSDLIFPHHENECAQSMCAHPDDSYAKYWVHAGMLMVDGVKMSKSLGNFYTVDDILDKHPAEALRLLFLSTNYNQPFNFTFDGLEKAKETLDKFYNALRSVSIASPPAGEARTAQALLGRGYNPDPRVLEVLADDLNTPLAISYLHEIAGDLNKAADEAEKTKAAKKLLASAGLLGLLYQTPEQWFQGGTTEDSSWIETKIQERQAAKKAKDFTKADTIRQELKTKGIILEDSPTATTWKKI